VSELVAVYVPGSSDGFSDKFSFRLVVGSLPVGSRIQFCLRYNSSGAEFWDSNNGTNYVFQVRDDFSAFNKCEGKGPTGRRYSKGYYKFVFNGLKILSPSKTSRLEYKILKHKAKCGSGSGQDPYPE
jgi:hypothetical protein